MGGELSHAWVAGRAWGSGHHGLLWDTVAARCSDAAIVGSFPASENEFVPATGRMAPGLAL